MTLAPGDEPAYLARAAAARDALAAEGMHCWIFRSRADRRLVLEFVEGPEGPGGGLPIGPGSSEALHRLEGIGARAPDAADLWDEVPLAPSEPPAGE